MCLDGNVSSVNIQQMTGYAFCRKQNDSYIPCYYNHYKYEKGVRYAAEDLEAEFGGFDGGFYFFKNKKDMLHVKQCIERMNKIVGVQMNLVGVLARFEGVFEKGTYAGYVAYRAQYRTILEEVWRK